MQSSANSRTKEGIESARAASEADLLLRLYSMPGFLVRRAKQATTLLFTERCAPFEMTPPQYAVLCILAARPGLDQGQVSDLAFFDDTTVSGILDRLQRRHLIERRSNGRRRNAFLTSEGHALMAAIKPVVEEVQASILAPLTERERSQILRLLSKMTGTNNMHHRARRRRN